MKTPQDLVSAAKAHITELSVSEAQSACQKSDVIIDVREPVEYAAGHIKNAISLPRGVLEFKIADLPEVEGVNTAILLYCQTSGRSALAAQSLAALGYTEVVSIAGGYEAWIAQDMPVVIDENISHD